jgi:hypothetical protein
MIASSGKEEAIISAVTPGGNCALHTALTETMVIATTLNKDDFMTTTAPGTVVPILTRNLAR